MLSHRLMQYFDTTLAFVGPEVVTEKQTDKYLVAICDSTRCAPVKSRGVIKDMEGKPTFCPECSSALFYTAMNKKEIKDLVDCYNSALKREQMEKEKSKERSKRRQERMKEAYNATI